MTKSEAKTASLEIEASLLQAGHQFVIGLDEVGRGAWAGPVVAGAVCLPLHDPTLSQALKGVFDSKQCTPRMRVALDAQIKATALAYGVGVTTDREIEQMGILPATRLAMHRALETARKMLPNQQVDFLILDKIDWKGLQYPHAFYVRGDQRSLTIAAASILAKVWRDAYMVQLGTQYPEYDFSHNKGYGTTIHQTALAQFGVCDAHRRNFNPMRSMLQDQQNQLWT